MTMVGEPDAPPPDPVDGPGEASSLEIAAGGLVRFASRPLRLATVLPTTVSAIVKTLRRARAGLRWPHRSPPRRQRSTPRSPRPATSRSPNSSSTTSRR
jgi:diacylglycerol O-acyltransferase / wax synthase